MRLDPRNVEPLQFLAENLGFMGAYAAADGVIERALTVAPAHPEIRSNKLRNLVHLDRDTGRARRLADELALDPGQFEESMQLGGLALLAGEYERARDLFGSWSRQVGALSRSALALWRARISLYLDEPASAAAVADTALAFLAQGSFEGVVRPAFTGWAHAMAGRRDAAMPLLEEAERGILSWEDHVDPTRWALDVVDGYGLLGEIDRGFALFDELIDRPSTNLSVSLLELDQRFDPYRADPRFDELIERRERFEVEAAEWAEANAPWLP